MNGTRGPSGAGFWLATGAGWSVIAFGALGLVDRLGARGALDVGAWVVAGNLVHDLALAPLVGLVTLGVALVLPRPWRAPLLAGLATSAIVLVVSIPLLGGFGRKPRNPSVLPLDYQRAVATVLAVVWAIVAAWCIAIACAHRSGRISRRRRAGARTEP